MSKWIVVSTIVIISLLGLLFHKYRQYQRQHFSCTVHFQADYKNLYTRTILRLVFNGDEGIAILTGEVKDEQDRHLALNRQMLFTFRENNAHYIMTSQKGIRESYDEVDKDLLSNLLNSFYFEEGVSMHYYIVKQPNNDYVVINGKLPMAYCHKP